MLLLIKIIVPSEKSNSLGSIFFTSFLIRKTCCHSFVLENLTIVFCLLYQVSISSASKSTSIFCKTVRILPYLTKSFVSSEEDIPRNTKKHWRGERCTFVQHFDRIYYIWDKVFNSGLSNFCGRQPLKNLKGYGLLSTLSPVLNTLSHLSVDQSKSCLQLLKPIL